MRRAAILLLALVAAWLAPLQTADAASPEEEIASLIATLGESGCEFERNGRWHGAERARKHLQRKYDWLRERGLAPTAELFIERAATQSSTSGRPYRVRCPGEAIVPASEWFRGKLQSIRHGSRRRPR